jgi:hypothetical protein
MPHTWGTSGGSLPPWGPDRLSHQRGPFQRFPTTVTPTVVPISGVPPRGTPPRGLFQWVSSMGPHPEGPLQGLARGVPLHMGSPSSLLSIGSLPVSHPVGPLQLVHKTGSLPRVPIQGVPYWGLPTGRPSGRNPCLGCAVRVVPSGFPSWGSLQWISREPPSEGPF